MFHNNRLLSVFVLICIALCHARRIESVGTPDGLKLGWRTDLQEQREFANKSSTVAWLLNLLSASHITPEPETEGGRADSRRDTGNGQAKARAPGCLEFFWKGRTAC